MIYLIAYDIENDKKRKKIADMLIQNGLSRIQYSVFLGSIKSHLLQQVKQSLQQHLNNPISPNDKILIMPIYSNSIHKALFLGQNSLSLREISGMESTIYIDDKM